MMDAPLADGGARPTWVEVDLDAVAHNFRVARAAAGGSAVFPVVKANAYGLGATPVARALAAAGADGFCVAMVEEARPLREAGIVHPLVILSGFLPGVEQAVIELNLQPVLFEMEAARALSRLRGGGGAPIPVHVKVDTGMGRMGFPRAKISAVLEELRGLPGIRVASILSHLACGDALTGEESLRQAERLEWAGDAALPRSLANSAGLLGHPRTRLAWSRPGIMLYGASPFFPARTWREDGLRPVARWLTRVVAVREVEAGTPLGYGHDFVTRRASRIGVLPVGYADGYSRCMQGLARVLIGGARAPVVGRISMDLTLVDLTDHAGAGIGAPVTLLGEQAGGFIGIEEMAEWMGTIPYEVLCRLGARLPRRHLRAGVNE
ncbi:MAG: alanine racemase [Magnetococcales bacterium]|nr:alanine racemase [Magnetococcales bacterium]